MDPNAQVVLEKFTRYFDVEVRLVPVSQESHYRLDLRRIETHIWSFRHIYGVSALLDKCQPASATPSHPSPFASPALEWDLRPRVVSINTSGGARSCYPRTSSSS